MIKQGTPTQQRMRDAMGHLNQAVKVPWDSGRELECTFIKLKVREAHGVLYSCLLPAIKVVKEAFEAFKNPGDEEKADPFAIANLIADIPNIVSEDAFWSMAESLLSGMLIDGREVDSMEDFAGDNIFLMYLLVFHGIKVNFPFSKLMPGLKSKELKNTTGESADDNDQS